MTEVDTSGVILWQQVSKEEEGRVISAGKRVLEGSRRNRAKSAKDRKGNDRATKQYKAMEIAPDML